VLQEHGLVAGLLDGGDNLRAPEFIDIGDGDRGAKASADDDYVDFHRILLG